jgi:VWFA-related protein
MLSVRVAVLPSLCAALLAQAPPEVAIRTHAYTPPSAILRADTNLVETRLIVRDSRGHGIAGLHASDFELLDNGAPKPIASFTELRSSATPSHASAGPAEAKTPEAPTVPGQPKYVTFFFDDFHIQNGNLLFVKQGARKFIAVGIKPGDHLSIVTASGESGDLDFTTDAERFAAALEHVRPHTRPVVTGGCGVSPIDSYIFLHNLDGDIRELAIGAAMPCAACSQNEPQAQCRAKAYSIAVSEASATWEQIHATSQDTMSALGFAAGKLSQIKGARVLVLTSSGFLLRPGEPPELRNFIDGALRWNITVHAIGAEGLEARMTGRKDMVRTAPYLMPLESIADATGGHYFKDANDLAGAMESATDPEVSYAVSFNAGEPDGKFHTVKIRVLASRGENLQYRPGYFSPDPEKQVSARARMDDAVFSKEAIREIPASVSLSPGELKNGLLPISVHVQVDLKNVQFTRLNGRHMQQIVFLTTLIDAKGEFVTGKESIMDMALTGDKLASMRKDGLMAITTLNAPAGIYQVRTIVREGVKGRLAAITIPVEVRTQ